MMMGRAFPSVRRSVGPDGNDTPNGSLGRFISGLTGPRVRDSSLTGRDPQVPFTPTTSSLYTTRAPEVGFPGFSLTPGRLLSHNPKLESTKLNHRISIVFREEVQFD